jgi:hypothetical protein
MGIVQHPGPEAFCLAKPIDSVQRPRNELGATRCSTAPNSWINRIIKFPNNFSKPPLAENRTFFAPSFSHTNLAPIPAPSIFDL